MKSSQRGEVVLGGCMLEDAAFRCKCGATTYDFDDRSADTATPRATVRIGRSMDETWS